MKKNYQRLLLSALIVATPAAHAVMGNTAETFGLFADDIATTQALSMFSNHAQAAYYNPAYLARDRAGAMSAGGMIAQPDVNAQPWGYPGNYLSSNGIATDPNYLMTLGFKTDLGKLLKGSPNVMFGMTLGADHAASQLVSVNSTTSNSAQSLRYGAESLFLNVGAGINPFRGLYVGAGANVTLSATAKLDSSVGFRAPASQVTNGTEQVNATPQVRPILSGDLNWGEILCPDDKYCWAQGLETALAWRAQSAVSSKINAGVFLTALPTQTPVNLLVNTIDGYAPETMSAALQYNLYKLRVGATIEWQRWSKLNSRLAGDTSYAQANLQFRDVFIPRVGFEYRWDNELSFLGGFSYEQSPLKGYQSLNINFIDNDAVAAGLGFSYLIGKPMFLAQPIRMDVGYQYRYLVPRDFMMSTSTPTGSTTNGCPSGTTCEYVTAKGGIQVLNASLHLTF